MRGDGEKSLKDVIKHMVKTYKLDNKLAQVQVVNQWEAIMGPTVAKNTEHIYLNKKCLYIKIKSAPLKQELFYGRDQLKDNVNEAIGQHVIDMVVFL